MIKRAHWRALARRIFCFWMNRGGLIQSALLTQLIKTLRDARTQRFWLPMTWIVSVPFVTGLRYC